MAEGAVQRGGGGADKAARRGGGGVLAAAVLALLAVQAVRADRAVLKDVTLGFGQALEQCREESQLTEEKMEEFFQFWRDDFKFEHRELGCAILCMSRHFNLLTDASRLHHDNARAFIRSFPNGEAVAQRMVALVADCERRCGGERDHCWRVLRVAECFRQACRDAGLAPAAERAIAEFIMDAEVAE